MLCRNLLQSICSRFYITYFITSIHTEISKAKLLWIILNIFILSVIIYYTYHIFRKHSQLEFILCSYVKYLSFVPKRSEKHLQATHYCNSPHCRQFIICLNCNSSCAVTTEVNWAPRRLSALIWIYSHWR